MGVPSIFVGLGCEVVGYIHGYENGKSKHTNNRGLYLIFGGILLQAIAMIALFVLD
jgi:uncharacterized membrane protein